MSAAAAPLLRRKAKTAENVMKLLGREHGALIILGDAVPCSGGSLVLSAIHFAVVMMATNDGNSGAQGVLCF